MNRSIVFIISIFFLLPVHSFAAGPRVGIIPFQNLSSDKSVDWIGLSMAKEITLELTKYSKVHVIDTVTVEKALANVILPKGTIPIATVKAVGQKLNARYMVFGDFQKFGDYVKVTAYVFDVDAGRVVETVKESGKLDEIFTVQDNIVRHTKLVILKLAATSAPAPKPKPKPQPKPRKPTVDENEITRRLMEEQSGVNPSLEDSATYKLMQEETSKYSAEEWFRKGVNLSDGSDREIFYYKKALEVDPKYGPALYNLGVVYYQRNQIDEAVRYFLSYLRYGKDPAKKSKIMTILQGLEGYTPQETAGDREAATYWYNKGVALGNSSDEEIRYYQWAIMADPTFAPAHYNLANIYYERGMYAEALKEYKIYMRYTQDPPEIKESVQRIIDYLEQVVRESP